MAHCGLVRAADDQLNRHHSWEDVVRWVQPDRLRHVVLRLLGRTHRIREEVAHATILTPRLEAVIVRIDRSDRHRSARGLLDASGRFTDAGRATKARIESLTDALAEAPYEVLDQLELDQLIAALEPISSRLEATGSNSEAAG